MNKKTKVLATSIATIVMTASLAVGGTFALFTSEDNVNVSVTSGTVKVLANVVEDSFATSTSLSSFTGTTEFELGGTVAYDQENGAITLTNVTPGDQFTFDVDLINESNVNIQYRVVMTMDGVLGEVLAAKATIDGVDYTFSSIGATNWVAANFDDATLSINDATKTDDIKIIIVLPDTVDDTYQNKSANLNVTVEAVQGNATTSNATLANSEASLKKALEKGDGEIMLTNDIEVSGSIDVSSNTKLLGDGCEITRADGYTGVVFNVAQGVNFEMENVIVDGGAVWVNTASAFGATSEVNMATAVNTGATATGALVQLQPNATVVLGKDVVLENNDGVPAVNPGTRTGGKVYINGATIQYNNGNGSGAIWGGGYIEINEGSKINYNVYYGTWGGSAVRMVSGCTLTMNGGEMNYNYSAVDGGAIFGYGDQAKPTYFNFNGGEMAYNVSTGVGGAMCTGIWTNVTMSGDFAVHHNEALAGGGAFRFQNHNTFTMTGGSFYDNVTSDGDWAIYGYDTQFDLLGGTIDGDVMHLGGWSLYIGGTDIDGFVYSSNGPTVNSVYLREGCNGFAFIANESNEHFANFNLDPYDGYVYTEGDEAKFVCLNESYETYWDEATSTFRLKAVS